MKIIKLGTVTKDTATGLFGMLTHLQVALDKTLLYLFQPRGINPETGQPVAKHWVVADRIEHGSDEDRDLPLEILGTEVVDKASGFKGIAICLYLHINGCVHILVQPKGTLQKTGAAIESHEFDIRRLTGSAIKEMTEDEQRADEMQSPSPSEMPSAFPRHL